MQHKNRAITVQLVKVENGFVIASNVKSLVAKTEAELTELMVGHIPELIEFLNKPEEQPNGTEDSRIVVPRGVMQMEQPV